MKEYQCVIFDCDGVLVDTEAVCNQKLCGRLETIWNQYEF